MTPTYLDVDAPLAPPTVRSLIPSHVWAWDTVEMNWVRFNALPSDLHAMGHPDRGNRGAYKANTARYGETVGAWYLVQRSMTRDGNEHLLILIDGKPVIEHFDDPYHDLSKRREEG